MAAVFGGVWGKFTLMQTAAGVRPSWGKRLIGIEGLRGVAAVAVVFHHTAASTTDHAVTGLLGNVGSFAREGLTLFFVLSGFLLYRPFAAAVIDGKRFPSVRRYATNRFLRIYPGYLVIFLATALLIGSVNVRNPSYGTGPDNVGRLTDPLQIIANLFIVQTYIPSYLATGIGPAWSLTAEIAFYLVLPVVSALAYRTALSTGRKVSSLLVAPSVMIAVGVAIHIWDNVEVGRLSPWDAAMFEWGNTWAAVLIRSFLGQADLFAYGMIAAVLMGALHSRGIHNVPTRVKVGLLGGAALLVLAAFTVVKSLDTNLTGVAAAMLVIAVTLPSASPDQSNRLARVLEWRPSKYMGLISYSIYLWHLPVILFLTSHSLTFGEDSRALFENFALVMVIVIPLATVTYYLVERPALKLKRGQRRQDLTLDARHDMASRGRA